MRGQIITSVNSPHARGLQWRVCFDNVGPEANDRLEEESEL